MYHAISKSSSLSSLLWLAVSIGNKLNTSIMQGTFLEFSLKNSMIPKAFSPYLELENDILPI